MKQHASVSARMMLRGRQQGLAAWAVLLLLASPLPAALGHRDHRGHHDRHDRNDGYRDHDVHDHDYNRDDHDRDGSYHDRPDEYYRDRDGPRHDRPRPVVFNEQELFGNCAGWCYKNGLVRTDFGGYKEVRDCKLSRPGWTPWFGIRCDHCECMGYN